MVRPVSHSKFPGWRAIVGCVLLSLTLPLNVAFAWGPGGHMVTASIAWETMKPETRQKAVTILQAHPAMDIWKGQLQKDSPPDQAAYFFSKSSTWPDEIRRHGSPYDHPQWHYVDYPLEPPNFPFVAGLDPDDNILFGINASEKTLADPAANAEQKSAALSWIIHLVGDIHQPLHCSTLVKPPTYVLPVGDKGGNAFYVAVGGAPINLHAFWDRLPGQIFSPPFAAASAERIRKTYPPTSLPELAKDKDPVSWSLEGRTLAIEKAYLHGRLVGASDSKIIPPPLPPDYLANSKVICDQRLALGGYRLAALLDQLMPTVTVPPAAMPASLASPAPSATASAAPKAPGPDADKTDQ